MAAATTSAARAQPKQQTAAYFTRIDPTFEYVIEPENVRDPRFEVAIYDDRAETGTVHVQFMKVGHSRRRVAAFDCTSVEQLDELMSDLASARNALGDW
jgi:hypothetical protein